MTTIDKSHRDRENQAQYAHFGKKLCIEWQMSAPMWHNVFLLGIRMFADQCRYRKIYFLSCLVYKMLLCVAPITRSTTYLFGLSQMFSFGWTISLCAVNLITKNAWLTITYVFKGNNFNSNWKHSCKNKIFFLKLQFSK